MKKLILAVVAVMLVVSIATGVAQAEDANTTLYFISQPVAHASEQFSHTLYGAELKYNDGEKGSISASYLAESSDTRGNSVFGFQGEFPLNDTWTAGVGLEKRRTNFDNAVNDYTAGTVKIGFKW